MDFMADNLGDGRQFQQVNVLVTFNREGHNITLPQVQPRKPQRKRVARYNRRVDTNGWTSTVFESIEAVRQRATAWLWPYDSERLNIGNGCDTCLETEGDRTTATPPFWKYLQNDRCCSCNSHQSPAL